MQAAHMQLIKFNQSAATYYTVSVTCTYFWYAYKDPHLVYQGQDAEDIQT